jgi:hypothetical protein
MSDPERIEYASFYGVYLALHQTIFLATSVDGKGFISKRALLDPVT